MRWPAYFFLAYVMLGVQLGVGAYAQVRGVGPNLVLLVVVFVSLNAPRAEAVLGSVLLGALQDLVTVQPFGLYAFAYGLVGVAVSRSAALVRRGHPLTHVSLALAGGAIVGVVLVVHDVVRPGARVGPRAAAVSAVYTAVLAPVVIGPLGRLNRWLGFEPSGRRRGRRH